MNKETIYYHKNSNVVAYRKLEYPNNYWWERTYNEKGNHLTFKDSGGYWNEYTYDERGSLLTYRASNYYYEIRGREVKKEEFEQFVNRPCVGKKVIVDGVEYTLN